jgi:hypothetical protein
MFSATCLFVYGFPLFSIACTCSSKLPIKHNCGFVYFVKINFIKIYDVSGDVWLGSLTKRKWRFYLTWASAFAGSQVYSGVALEFNTPALLFSERNNFCIHSIRSYIHLTFQNTVVPVCTVFCKVKNFHILPTQVIYVFCVDLRINSSYFPIQQ